MTFDVDGEQYVYTKFEPYGAHKVFPCFDQPDIKAKMKISVVSRPEWTVASNQAVKETHQFDASILHSHASFEHAASS